MFRIEDGPDGSLSQKRVVDHERGVWLKFVSGRGEEGGMVLKLVVGERVIPFEVSVEEKRQADGTVYFREAFDAFGYSPRARAKGVDGAIFDSNEERDKFLLLAAEAVLVFGGTYNGLSKPEGFFRVDLNGRDYTLASFGYTGSGHTGNARVATGVGEAIEGIT